MYLELLHATENAINFLISAQQKAEEMYLYEPKPKMKLIDFKKENIFPEDSEGPTH